MEDDEQREKGEAVFFMVAPRGLLVLLTRSMCTPILIISDNIIYLVVSTKDKKVFIIVKREH